MTPDEMLAAIRLVVERHEEMGLKADEAIDEIVAIIRRLKGLPATASRG